MSEVERIHGKAASAVEFARQYLDHVAELVRAIDPQPLADLTDALFAARDAGKTIFIMGNGGSAATAMHFACDLALCTAADRPPFRVVNLADSLSTITALANDHGYEGVFERRLRGHAGSGDVVIAISASGNSPNLLTAIRYASEQGCTVVGVTGFGGGALRERSDIAIHVPTDTGDYGPAESLHLLVEHVVCNYVMLQDRRS